jgi:hypothetical protein
MQQKLESISLHLLKWFVLLIVTQYFTNTFFSLFQANGGDGPNNVAYSNSTDLDMGVNGNDVHPFVFARFSNIPLLKLAKINSATLRFSADRKQFVSSRGVLYLEVAVEVLDNANHPLTGNILSTGKCVVCVCIIVRTKCILNVCHFLL